MTVRFEFELSVLDAENLFGLFNQVVAHNNSQMQKCMVNEEWELVDNYKSDIEYLERLKNKLTNWRI